jgi:hypothetical protein
VDVYTYFEQRVRECAKLSVTIQGDLSEMFAGLEGSNARRGRVFGQVIFSERVFLAVNELVEVQGNHVHREEYAYFLVIDGEEVWGEERDPTHDPAVHSHYGSAHERVPSHAVSFKEVVERVWEEITQRAEGGESLLV